MYVRLVQFKSEALFSLEFTSFKKLLPFAVKTLNTNIFPLTLSLSLVHTLIESVYVENPCAIFHWFV